MSVYTYALQPVKKSDLRSEEPVNKDKVLEQESFRIDIRVPPVYPDKPALWFATMEAQFAIANIKTEEMKYNFVVGYLDPEYARMIDDVICSPPSHNKYENLKTKLIKRISVSQEEKLRERLMKEEMGNRTPTEFFQYLSKKAGAEASEELLTDVWLSLLPNELRKFMDMMMKPNPKHYAKIADAFVENNFVRSESPTSDTEETTMGDLSEQISELRGQVEALNRKIEKLTQLQQSSSRSPEHSTSNTTPGQSTLPNCWYHSFYGDKAERCDQPCGYVAAQKAKT